MAVDIYLTIDGIKGESNTGIVKDAIEVSNWNHSFTHPISDSRSTGDGSAGRTQHADFGFSKRMCSASMPLLKAMWEGKTIKDATFAFYTNGTKSMEIKLETVKISNMSLGGGSDSVPGENYSMNYGKITYNYVQIKEDGTAAGSQPVSCDLIKEVIA